MTRKALGRGLSALIRDSEPAQPQTSLGIENISVDALDPNPSQPRQALSPESLQELADSIRASGVVQPVLVRRYGDRYQLIAGERRWRAARLSGIDSIPAIIRDIDDREALEMALVENLLREDLNPLDVARAYGSLQDNFRLSHDEIARRLGLNRSTVTNALRLLRLPPQVQEMIRSGSLTAGHARSLVTVEDPSEQVRLANVIVKRQLSVRQAEQMLPRNAAHKVGAADSGERRRQEPNVRAAQLELERTLGTRVKIVGNEQRGRIEISYFSSEDLQRIYGFVTSRAGPTG